jgi:hypothetical protein
MAMMGVLFDSGLDVALVAYFVEQSNLGTACGLMTMIQISDYLASTYWWDGPTNMDTPTRLIAPGTI